MTNKTLTALIIRLAGFALFVKIFDFFGSYFMSIYISAQLAAVDQTNQMVDSFDKLYITGAMLSFANLFLSLFLVFKADWIASKITNNESEIKIDLTPKSLMRIIIATIGIIYCAKTLYVLPTTLEDVITLLNRNQIDGEDHLLTGIINFIIRAGIGILFILKSDQLSSFSMKRMKLQ